VKTKILIILILIIIISTSGIYFLMKPDYNIKNLNSQGKNLICFGNSLTEGVGAPFGYSFPDYLSKELPFPVINAGKGGDTTFDALNRINSDVLQKNPFLVIIEFGANDILKRISPEDTFKNLEMIIDKIQEAGAAVVLVEVKVNPLKDVYLPKFKEIAQQKKIYLIPDVLEEIYQNKNLMSSDNMHPNEHGYKVLAEKILNQIKPILRKMGKL